MAENWFADVQKYHAGADEGVVKKIVNYLGIALRNRDSSLVSFSDPEEVGRVRERFLQKKLGLTDSDDVLNKALDEVKEMMKGDRTKNRVTVYYLLADWFGKLDLFGGSSSPSGSFSFASLGGAAAAGAAGLASAAMAGDTDGAGGATTVGDGRAPDPTPPSATASTSSGEGGGSGGATTVGDGRATAQSAYSAPEGDPPPSYGSGDGDGDGGGGFPGWLKWLLLLAALVLLFLLLKSCLGGRDADDASVNAAAGTELSADANLTADANATVGAEGDAAAAAAIPAGAGVVAGEAAGKPMLTVYFDVGKREVSNDLAAQAATLKAYLDANAGSKLAVSGYNDPSGNAAANAELSKNRAQAVKAALVAAGIPDAAVELVKPADTTAGAITPEQARRVEVTIQ